MSCRLVGLGVPSVHRPVLAGLVGSARLGRLVLICHLVLSHPWAARVRSHVWFPCSRRSVLLVARSSLTSFVGFGSCPRSWGGAVSLWAWGGGALFSSVSSVPSFAPTRYSFARCWMDTVMGGYGAPFHVARRSSIACSCRIVHPISSGFPSLPFVSSSPHPKQKKMNETETETETQGNKTRRPTRRRHETGNETPSDENGRTTTKGNETGPLF